MPIDALFESTIETGHNPSSALAATCADCIVADSFADRLMQTIPSAPSSAKRRNVSSNAPTDGAAVSGSTVDASSLRQNSSVLSSLRSTYSSSPKRIVSGTTSIAELVAASRRQVRSAVGDDANGHGSSSGAGRCMIRFPERDPSLHVCRPGAPPASWKRARQARGVPRFRGHGGPRRYDDDARGPADDHCGGRGRGRVAADRAREQSRRRCRARSTPTAARRRRRERTARARRRCGGRAARARRPPRGCTRPRRRARGPARRARGTARAARTMLAPFSNTFTRNGVRVSWQRVEAAQREEVDRETDQRRGERLQDVGGDGRVGRIERRRAPRLRPPVARAPPARPPTARRPAAGSASPSEKSSRRPALSPAVACRASSGVVVVMIETANNPCGSWKKMNAY